MPAYGKKNMVCTNMWFTIEIKLSQCELKVQDKSNNFMKILIVILQVLFSMITCYMEKGSFHIKRQIHIRIVYGTQAVISLCPDTSYNE